MDRFTKAFSEKGKPLLVLDEFKFRKCTISKNGIKWRCTIKSCISNFLCDVSETVLLKSNFDHNHEASSNINRQIVANSLKRKATDQVTTRPLKLIRNEVQSSALDLTLNDVHSIRRSVYRTRRKTLPPLPKNVTEVHTALNNLDTNTYKGENLLLINDNMLNIICFSTKSNLEFLCSCDKIFVDGTFEFCSKYFYQFFTIHGLKNGHYIPLIFSLLPNKLPSTYEYLFRVLISKCATFNIDLNPKTVVADFEQGIHFAVKQVWPSILLVGCRFHLSQAWWRNIQSCGLQTEYKNPNSEVGKWLHLVFGLSLFSHEEVEDVFVEELMTIQPINSNLTKFTNYLVENYISSNSTFPPKLWASNSISCERTTNACEAFHASFSTNFYSPHPNIFVFLKVIIETQTSTYIAINSIEQEKYISNRAYLKKKLTINSYIDKYKSGEISRNEFLKIVCYHYCKNV